jgi:hypothetical protein
MYVIYDAENGLWLKSVNGVAVWTDDVDKAMTWDSTCAATEAATAAGICTCWVVAK